MLCFGMYRTIRLKNLSEGYLEKLNEGKITGLIPELTVKVLT